MPYEPSKNLIDQLLNTRDLIKKEEDSYPILSAIKNHESLDSYLHQSKFDPNQIFEHRRYSLLTAAINHKNPEAAHLLIQSGADVNLPDGHQRTPLSYAGESNDLKLTQSLLQQGASIDDSCLHWTLEHPQIVDEFLKNGANPNGIENNERMLDLAVELTPPETVQLLISAGAEINYQGEFGHTALHTAVHHEKTENAQVLLKNGADISIENNRGETALSKASPAMKQVFADFEKQELQKKITHALTSVPRKRLGG